MLVGVLHHCVRVVGARAVTGFKMASTEALAAGKKAAAVAAVDELVKVYHILYNAYHFIHHV